MANDDGTFELSRRKALAGLGTIGVASAGAGLGTSAFFSDTESFENNTMVAGELDLRVDWQQMYYGPTEQWEFVNAHPDDDGDGIQSLDADGDETDEYKYTDENRNIVDQLDCSNLDHDYDFGDQDSLVDLSDVKPGDEGEITFSLHLCDNPGYIWLTADNFSESGGSLTEPERVSMDEDDPDSVKASDDTGDLAENMFVEFWYDDDCDNELDRGTDTESEPVCVQLVLDASASMDGSKNDETIAGAQSLASSILNANPDNRVGVTFFSGSGYDTSAEIQLSVDSTNDVDTVTDTIGDLPADGGSTAIGAGIEAAQNDLVDCPDSHDRIMVVLSNGGENSGTDPVGEADAACTATPPTQIFTIAIGSGNETLMEQIACDSADAYTAASASNVQAIFDEITEEIQSGESIILGKGDGEHTDHVTLAEAMAIMDRNGGRVPLDADGSMGYDAGPTSEERDCFEGEKSYCIGAHWWVPTDVGNEIQGDSVSFDLGFYTEQCRHNDGSGQA